MNGYPRFGWVDILRFQQEWSSDSTEGCTRNRTGKRCCNPYQQPYELTNLQTYELTLRVRASHFGLPSHKLVFKNCRQTIFKNKNDQDNASGIKDLLNGKTLNDFSIMFDEAIDCVKGLDI